MDLQIHEMLRIAMDFKEPASKSYPDKFVPR